MRAANTFQQRSESSYRRHIAVVTETYSPEVNGVALTLGHLVQGLRQLGHEVSLVRPRQRADRHDPRRDPAATLVPGVPLPVYRDLRAGLPSGGALRRLWQRRRPDAVYVATEGPLGWSALRAARALGIPVFSGFHTNFHSYLKHYHVGWSRFFVLRYLRWFHGCADGTLVPSLELRTKLHDLGVRNVSILGRGVDSELFHPRRRSAALRRTWGVAENDLVALCVGRVAPEKNLELAIEAYRAMRRGASSTKLVVVGDGPLRAALEEKHPEIIFCGVQTGEALAAYYASADLFLFPSETETFGIRDLGGHGERSGRGCLRLCRRAQSY
jgi:glycosyltransferase involved in cell wall biosynthesis